MEQTAIPNVFVNRTKRGSMLFTKNLTPGKYLARDNLLVEEGVEYRYWDPKRSKLGSAMLKGLNPRGLTTAISILYLGASSGTTVSYVSDILGNEGMIFALDFAPKTTRDLLYLADERQNISPILGDAKNPETYLTQVFPSEILYQDIAQKNQVDIFLRNARLYLKPKGFGYLCIKSRSIDVAKNPEQIYSMAAKEMQKEMEILDIIRLDPFQKDHALIVCQRK